MSRRTWLVTIALAVVTTMLATACDSSSRKSVTKRSVNTTTTAAPFAVTPTREISVKLPLVSMGPNGRLFGRAVGVEVGIRPATDRNLRVKFQETAVGGTAAQWQAAGWNTVAVATLITGAPLAGREIDFQVTGRLDGLSAGALMTVAVIALIRGDALAGDITITGAINPDGSIGPVADVARKVEGVVAAHDARLLIPTGQRNDIDEAGRPVDVVDAAPAKGVQVMGVASIFDAYQQFTGRALPSLPESTDTRLDEPANRKMQATVASWLAKFSSSTHDFQALAPEVQQSLGSYAAAAARDAQQAQTLSDEGMPAGAFRAAVSAAALVNALAQTGRSLPVLLTQGAPAFVSRVRASQPLTEAIRRVMGTLRAFEPKSVSDVAALVSAYRDALDAMSLSAFASKLFGTRATDRQQAINEVAEGAIYFFVAGSLADAARDVLGAARGLGGPAPGSATAASDAARLLRGAGEANLSAFQSLVIVPRMTAAQTSLGAAERAFAVSDLDYALARAGDNLISASPTSVVGGATTGYAELAGALAFYERTAALLAKYYVLGRIDPNTRLLAGIGDATSFDAVVQRAQTQLAATIGSLRSKLVMPVSAVADYELASSDGSGDASDRFDALGEYWDGYLNSRALAYVGGFSGP